MTRAVVAIACGSGSVARLSGFGASGVRSEIPIWMIMIVIMIESSDLMLFSRSAPQEHLKTKQIYSVLSKSFASIHAAFIHQTNH